MPEITLIEGLRQAMDEELGGDGRSLLSLNEPVHLVLVREDAATGDRQLVSARALEWRSLLATSEEQRDMQGAWSVSVEMHGVGAEAQLTIGILHCKLQLIPRYHP